MKQKQNYICFSQNEIVSNSYSYSETLEKIIKTYESIISDTQKECQELRDFGQNMMEEAIMAEEENLELKNQLRVQNEKRDLRIQME